MTHVLNPCPGSYHPVRLGRRFRRVSVRRLNDCRRTRLRPGNRPLLLALTCLALAGIATPPAAAQTPEGEWEIVLTLDSDRHRLRRVRPIIVRASGLDVQAPALGETVFGWIHNAGWVPESPGLSTEAVDSAVTTVVEGEGTATGEARTLGGRSYERFEYPAERGLQWRDADSGRPVWSLIYLSDGADVLRVELPRLRLVPREFGMATNHMAVVVHHAADGAPDWAFATALAGSRSRIWLAYWKSPDATGAPADLDAALDTLPFSLIRDLRRKYLETESWRPLRALFIMPLSIRYNKVEGGSLALPLWYNIKPTIQVNAWVRASTTSYPMTGGGGISIDHWPGAWGVEGYRKLADANRWETGLGKNNSFQTFLHGRDTGHYYTATGGALWAERDHGDLTWRFDLFAERHRAATTRTDWSLFPASDTTWYQSLDVDDVDVFGISGSFERQWGLFLGDGVVIGRFWGTAAKGDQAWLDLGAGVDGLREWGHWALGARASVAGIVGHAPLQRQYFLGAASTVRGFLPGVVHGPAMALGRVEGGWGVPALRGVLFTDVGWAGESGSLDGIGSAGIGLSIGQGIFRIDLAKSYFGKDSFAISFTGNGVL